MARVLASSLLWLLVAIIPLAWSWSHIINRSFAQRQLLPLPSLHSTLRLHRAGRQSLAPRCTETPLIAKRADAVSSSPSNLSHQTIGNRRRQYITSVVPIDSAFSVAASITPTIVASYGAEYSPLAPETSTLKIGYQTRLPESKTSTLTANPTSTATAITPATGNSSTNSTKAMAGQDIFMPISYDGPPASIPINPNHPLKKQHIVDNGTTPTNKFFANMFLGTQTMPVFTHPYSLVFTKGSHDVVGIGVSHIDRGLLTLGPVQRELPGAPARFYLNPMGIWSFILSAKELDNSTSLTVTEPTAFSANAVLSGGNGNMTLPMLQGMGFVTAQYSGNLTPLLSTVVFFRNMTSVGTINGSSKYRVTLENNSTWLIYATADNRSPTRLTLSGNNTITGPPNFRGIIQVTKNPGGMDEEGIFDFTMGNYARTMHVAGIVDGDAGKYRFLWTKEGYNQSAPLLMYALPHHVESFDQYTKVNVTNLKLQTTTKGEATAVLGDYWTMEENDLPIDMDFAPYKPGKSTEDFSEPVKAKILDAARAELQQNIAQNTDVSSMYFSGKGLAKYAFILYTVQGLLKDAATAKDGLERLKQSFATFVENRQQVPLYYDDVWKGVVSSGTYNTGDPNADFGNTYYNDHHFHYGYFVLAGAIIGRLDPSWLTDQNKGYVNTLLRDAGNSVPDDPYYPFSRGFDWYHGHSWAKGLFESADGKDQESTSEDTMFAYAVKMWGKTVGDASTEARGNLMLGLLRRSLNNYFLMASDNKVQPMPFIANKVTGILFENKADHTTYFGTNLEYIQGIHMLPLFPASPYVRSEKFVNEEWNAMFAENAVDPASRVEGGWKGVLYANDAIRDAKESWNFFAQPNFNNSWLDNGASLTWSLAFAAGLGGAP